MNIIHLVTNRVWGGGEQYVLDLCRALRADGHNVGVLTRNSAPVRDVFEAEGLRVGSIGPGGPLDILSPVRLARHLRGTDGPVTVHTHNFKDAATAAGARRLMPDGARVRIVCTRHLVKPAPTQKSRQRLLGELDAIVFVSDIARRTFMSNSPDIDPGRLHTVLNALPDPGEPEARDTDTERPPKIIYAGRIVPEKGLDVMLKALGRLQAAQWTTEIYGTGRGRDVMPLINLSKSLGIAERVSWPGHVGDLSSRMSSADIGVFPSRVPESFGLAIAECMARGLPVVTTDNGAQPEIITHGVEGLLVPPDDPAATAEALKRLIENPALRRDMGAKARMRFTSQFTYERFYREIVAIYDSLNR